MKKKKALFIKNLGKKMQEGGKRQQFKGNSRKCYGYDLMIGLGSGWL